MNRSSKFTSEDLSRWKQINPAPIVAKRMKLQRVNNEFLGCCPDVFHKKATGHSDRNPSFTIYKLEDGTWGYKCFSCGANGNVFQFVQNFDGISFPKAVERVLQEAGVEGWQDGQDQAEVDLPESAPKEPVTFPLKQYQPTTEALEQAPQGQEWLHKRGITMETARAFKLGFVQSAEKISPKHLWRDDGWVLFPTLSANGQTITAVKYRSLIAKKEKVAGETISGILRALDTSTTLFNAQTVLPGEDLWIVEGEPDAIVLQQAGLTAVGLPMAGYTPTEDECDRLSTAKRIFLAGDSDSEGKKAMDKLAERLSGATFRINWPNNRKDANDVLTNECGNDAAKFKALVDNLCAKTTRVAADIEFHTPALPDPDGEYVIAPAEGQDDGWFPRGDISLIGGASGTGKTTWIFEMLHKQKQGWPVLEHRTHKYSFHVLAYDRGKNAFTRTLRRLKLLPSDIPTTPLPLAFGKDAVQGVINHIESMNPIPNIIFIEGLDMLIDDANRKSIVAPFMRHLQEVAAHFHIAIIGSVGAPKTKNGEGYAAKRDHLSGSEAWGRNCETVAIIEFGEDEDGTAPRRELTILPRNATAEKFSLQFEAGKLVQVQPTQDENRQLTGRPNRRLQKAIRFLETRLQNGPRDIKQLLRDALDLEDIKRGTLYNAAEELHVVKLDGQWELPPPMNAVLPHESEILFELGDK